MRGSPAPGCHHPLRQTPSITVAHHEIPSPAKGHEPTLDHMTAADPDWITVVAYENLPGSPRPMAAVRA